MQHARLARRHWLLAFLLALSAHAAGMWLLLGGTSEALVPAGAGAGLQISLAAGAGGGQGGGGQQTVEQPVVQKPIEQQSTQQQPTQQSRPELRREKHRHHERKPRPEKKRPQPEKAKQLKQEQAPQPEPHKPEPQAVAAPNEGQPDQTALADQMVSEHQAVGGGAGGHSQQTQTQAGDGRAVGAGSSLESSYAGQLLAWLERHKEYPRLARMQRKEGTVLLEFRLSRDGRVLDYRVSRSSGNRLLDKAVREMLIRAQPLPPIPDAIAGEELAVTLPIDFKLW